MLSITTITATWIVTMACHGVKVTAVAVTVTKIGVGPWGETRAGSVEMVRHNKETTSTTMSTRTTLAPTRIGIGMMRVVAVAKEMSKARETETSIAMATTVLKGTMTVVWHQLEVELIALASNGHHAPLQATGEVEVPKALTNVAIYVAAVAVAATKSAAHARRVAHLHATTINRLMSLVTAARRTMISSQLVAKNLRHLRRTPISARDTTGKAMSHLQKSQSRLAVAEKGIAIGVIQARILRRSS